MLLHIEANLGFYLPYLVFFTLKFVHLEFCIESFFTMYYFKFFLQEWINHTGIPVQLELLVSKMELTTILAKLVPISRAKLWKIVMKFYVFLALGLLFSKFFLRSFWGSDIFSHLVLIQSTHFFCDRTYV